MQTIYRLYRLYIFTLKASTSTTICIQYIIHLRTMTNMLTAMFFESIYIYIYIYIYGGNGNVE